LAPSIIAPEQEQLTVVASIFASLICARSWGRWCGTPLIIRFVDWVFLLSEMKTKSCQQKINPNQDDINIIQNTGEVKNKHIPRLNRPSQLQKTLFFFVAL
jgi:hypothetical protein